MLAGLGLCREHSRYIVVFIGEEVLSRFGRMPKRVLFAPKWGLPFENDYLY
jgi:hypothetical protein